MLFGEYIIIMMALINHGGIQRTPQRNDTLFRCVNSYVSVLNDVDHFIMNGDDPTINTSISLY